MKGVNFLFVVLFAFVLSSCDKEATYECTCYATLSPNNGGAGVRYAESKTMTVTSTADAQAECDMLKSERVMFYQSITDSSAAVNCELIRQ